MCVARIRLNKIHENVEERNETGLKGRDLCHTEESAVSFFRVLTFCLDTIFVFYNFC